MYRAQPIFHAFCLFLLDRQTSGMNGSGCEFHYFKQRFFRKHICIRTKRDDDFSREIISLVFQERPYGHRSRMPPDRTANENDIIAIEVFYFAGKRWPNTVIPFFFGFIRAFSEFIGIRSSRSMRNKVPPVCSAIVSAIHRVLPLRLKYATRTVLPVSHTIVSASYNGTFEPVK